jgi:protein TonB
VPPPDFVAAERLPVPVRQVVPTYPVMARRARLEGRVIVKAWVDRHGRVRQAEVMRSDLHVFDRAALDAVSQWIFTPALQNGEPIDMWVSIPVTFRLR